MRLVVTGKDKIYIMGYYETLKNDLGKLKRNELMMDDDQKVKYAAQIEKLKSRIMSNARMVMNHFFVSGFLADEQDTEGITDVIKKKERLVEEWEYKGKIKKAYNILFTTYDIEMFLEPLIPLQIKILYEAYGPYWLSHCKPVTGDEFTFKNDIIDMEWWEGHNEWAAVKTVNGEKAVDYEKGITVMLPPTRELLEKEYATEMKGLEK